MKHFPQLEKVTFVLRFLRYNVTREVVYTRSRCAEAREVGARGPEPAACIPQMTILCADGIPRRRSPRQHCAYCPKLRSCPLGDLNPMTEDPTDVMRRALWAQQLLKHDMATLKAHVNINGPIQISDANGVPYCANFKLQQKTSYPAIPVLSLISANDPELAQKLTISGLSQR
jgi:hypothetical protein